MTHKIIRLPAVMALTGLSRSSIYLRMSKGHFPKNISLGERAMGWLEEEVNQWLEDKIATSKARRGNG